MTDALEEKVARAICLSKQRMGDTDAVAAQYVETFWRDYLPEASIAVATLLPLIAKPSSPAGGDVREAKLWDILDWIANMSTDQPVTNMANAGLKLFPNGRPAALSPSSSAAEPVAWLTEWQFKAPDYPVKYPGGGSYMTRDAIDAANVLANKQRWDPVDWVRQTPLYAHPAPAAVESAQGVKALEWDEYETEGEVDRWDAETALGTFYEISTQFDGYHVAHDCTHLAARFDTLDQAKAAAQADYEARIRACLATDKEGRDV
ncbi:hypothetical protein [Bosea sp. AS-1]|uniref:hypothetical protein n=1 Tax=Bosea sp. AS-1 TaxID=2015316 RepID=UPI000B78137D|nr:hypothetical protein [Bosea sp. AS-1]